MLGLMGKEANGESFSRHGEWIHYYHLIGYQLFPVKPFDYIVHENQNLQSSVLFPRTHPWPSPEGDKCVRSWSTAFESCRLELLWLREALGVFVG